MADLACPACGAPQGLKNPGIVVLSCAYCGTALFREGGLLRAGERAMLAEPQSSIAVGAHGTVAGRAVEVVGRAQFAHATGRWDEWCVDDGGVLRFLTEDERNYTLEVEADGPLPDLATLSALNVGDTLRFRGRPLEVDEIGEARCVGVEGQIPRLIEPGAAYRYADLAQRDGNATLGIEVHGSRIEVFAGTALDPSDVRFGPPVEQTPLPARAISCAGCGAGLDLGKQKDIATAVCASCSAILDLQGEAAKVVGHNPLRPGFDLKVGERGRFDGAPFEVVSRLLWDDDGDTSEYLLWNAERGYRWLEECDGNFVLLQATQEGPSAAALRTAIDGQRFVIGGERFRVAERGTARLKYVDGALPWEARTGDTNRYLDLAAPPRLYSVELGKDEIERFVGRHVPTDEVWAAFSRKDAAPPRTGVGIAQPSPVGSGQRALAVILAVAVVANLLLSAWAGLSGDELMSVSASSTQPDEVLSEPFTVPSGTRTLSLRVGTNLSNNWASVQATLYDEQDAAPFGTLLADLEYFHGYEGGESWSEGSRDQRRSIRSPPPGTYRLGVAVEAEENSAVEAMVRVERDRWALRWPVGLSIACAFFPMIAFIRHAKHEKERLGLEWEAD